MLFRSIHGAYGVLAALLERERTGRGKVVRTSLIAGMVGIHAFQGTRATIAGMTPQPGGNHHATLAPYGLFSCRDGAVQISVGNEKMWQRFCEAFDLDAADPRFATNGERFAHRDELISEIEERFAHFDAAPLLEKLAEAGIPAGVVRTLPEVYEWEQALSQGLRITTAHPTIGDIDLPGPPLRFFDADGSGETETTVTEHIAPPRLSADEQAIRDWLEG